MLNSSSGLSCIFAIFFFQLHTSSTQVRDEFGVYPIKFIQNVINTLTWSKRWPQLCRTQQFDTAADVDYSFVEMEEKKEKAW